MCVSPLWADHSVDFADDRGTRLPILALPFFPFDLVELRDTVGVGAAPVRGVGLFGVVGVQAIADFVSRRVGAGLGGVVFRVSLHWIAARSGPACFVSPAGGVCERAGPFSPP